MCGLFGWWLYGLSVCLDVYVDWGFYYDVLGFECVVMFFDLMVYFDLGGVDEFWVEVDCVGVWVVVVCGNVCVEFGIVGL